MMNIFTIIQEVGQVASSTISFNWEFSIWAFIQFLLTIIGFVIYVVRMNSKIDVLEKILHEETKPVITTIDQKIRHVVNESLNAEKSLIFNEIRTSNLEITNRIDSKFGEITNTISLMSQTIDTLKENNKLMNNILQKHESGINEIYRDYMPKFKNEIVTEIKEYIDQSNEHLRELISKIK